jgi:hypothetical protein
LFRVVLFTGTRKSGILGECAVHHNGVTRLFLHWPYQRGKSNMRFAAVPPRQPELRSSAAEFIRRLVGGDPKPAEAQLDAKKAAADVPLDLDQRVRLVGEW